MNATVAFRSKAIERIPSFSLSTEMTIDCPTSSCCRLARMGGSVSHVDTFVKRADDLFRGAAKPLQLPTTFGRQNTRCFLNVDCEHTIRPLSYENVHIPVASFLLTRRTENDSEGLHLDVYHAPTMSGMAASFGLRFGR